MSLPYHQVCRCSIYYSHGEVMSCFDFEKNPPYSRALCNVVYGLIWLEQLESSKINGQKPYNILYQQNVEKPNRLLHTLH